MTPPQHGPAWGKIALAVLIVAALAAAWRFTPLSELLTGERIAAWARVVRETSWAPFAVVLLYTPAAFVMFPRPLLTLLTVIAFGGWLGFTYSMAGILLSAYATYYAGRFLERRTVERLAGRHLEPVSRALRRHGLLAMFTVRIVPAAPFLVEGVVAGALRVKQWHYGVGTFLGMLPGVLATTVFGDQIATVFDDPSKASWWLVGAAVLVLVATTFFVRRWMAREQAASA